MNKYFVSAVEHGNYPLGFATDDTVGHSEMPPVTWWMRLCSVEDLPVQYSSTPHTTSPANRVTPLYGCYRPDGTRYGR